MRDCDSQGNIIEILDGISGDIHEFRYRMPTNKERAAYAAKIWRRHRNRMVNCTFDTRLEFGERILIGFKKGTLALGGKPFSSDPKDPDYRADWKKIVIEKAGDLVSHLAQAVFERGGNDISEIDEIDLGDKAGDDRDDVFADMPRILATGGEDDRPLD